MTNRTTAITRTPYCHKIRYGITGAPILDADEMDGSFAPGVGVRPTLIELVYSPARDGQPARIAASVTGDWMRFGKPEEFGGQVTTHFKSGPDGWPVWLAEEARLHDPGAELAAARGQAIAWAADVVDEKLTAEPDHNRASALYELLLQLRGELPCTCARSGGLHSKGCRKYVPGHELISRHNQLDVYRAAAVAPDAASAPPGGPVSPVQPSSVSESAQSPTGAPTGRLGDLPPTEDLASADNPTQLRWGLNDALWGDDGSVIVMLSGPDREAYWLELNPERAAVLREDLAGPDGAPSPERDTLIAELLPAWEAMYEPGNVSTYLIGYANSEAGAKGAAEAWMRSQAEVTGRLEWEQWSDAATLPDGYDALFELIERHDDGIDTGPGIAVRRRIQPTT